MFDYLRVVYDYWVVANIITLDHYCNKALACPNHQVVTSNVSKHSFQCLPEYDQPEQL